MKKLCLLFLLSGNCLFAEASLVGGFLNDNYTGSLENGVEGRYIGVDDFLTFSLFANLKSGKIDYSLYYQIVTSRVFEYRYDLLINELQYNIRRQDYTISPSIGWISKGDFGGDSVQNGMHDFRGIPEVDMEYLDSENAPFVGIDASYSFFDSLSGIAEIECPLAIKPVSISVSLEEQLDLNIIQLDFLLGYKQYVNQVSEYSEFVRSGFHAGGQFILFFSEFFVLNAGVFFFPVQNVCCEEEYYQRDYSYSPQFWVCAGLRKFHWGIMDIMRY